MPIRSFEDGGPLLPGRKPGPAASTQTTFRQDIDQGPATGRAASKPARMVVQVLVPAGLVRPGHEAETNRRTIGSRRGRNRRGRDQFNGPDVMRRPVISP